MERSHIASTSYLEVLLRRYVTCQTLEQVLSLSYASLSTPALSEPQYSAAGVCSHCEAIAREEQTNVHVCDEILLMLWHARRAGGIVGSVVVCRYKGLLLGVPIEFHHSEERFLAMVNLIKGGRN